MSKTVENRTVRFSALVPSVSTILSLIVAFNSGANVSHKQFLETLRNQSERPKIKCSDPFSFFACNFVSFAHSYTLSNDHSMIIQWHFYCKV